MDKPNSIPSCWEIRTCGREEGGFKAGELGVCIASREGMGHSCWVNAGFLGDCEDTRDSARRDLVCQHCEVYYLYNRGNGKEAQRVFDECPEEYRRATRILRERLTSPT